MWTISSPTSLDRWIRVEVVTGGLSQEVAVPGTGPTRYLLILIVIISVVASRRRRQWRQRFEL